MLPFVSMSTPVALLHAVMPVGNVAQLSTNRYDPESAAMDGRLAADWSTTAAHTTAIRTRLIKGSFRRAVFGRRHPTRRRGFQHVQDFCSRLGIYGRGTSVPNLPGARGDSNVLLAVRSLVARLLLGACLRATPALPLPPSTSPPSRSCGINRSA